jgi:AcrR family transcriptional regulator
MTVSSSTSIATRTYDSSRRRREAARRRRRMVDAAHRLFLEHGYGSTSIEDIAEAADVAVPTVYAAFGSKAGLLKQVVDISIVGDDEEVGVRQRPEFARIVSDAPIRQRLPWAAALAYDVHARSAPLVRLVASVAGADPAVAELHAGIERQRSEDNRAVVDSIPPAALRDDLTVDEAAALIELYAGPAAWSMLVTDGGWSRERYERWVIDVIGTTVLTPEKEEAP